MQNTLKLNSESSANLIQFEIEMLRDFYEFGDSEKEASKSKLHFLVVDDDYDLVSYVQDCLYINFDNITVVAVSSGEKALSEITQKTPDVLITDLSMPELNGFQLITKLRLIEGSGNAKILVITGKELSKRESQKLIELEISGILRKPFDSDELKTTIDEITENN